MSQGKLLVVEDDEGLREALVDTLLLAGYNCSEVDSGEAALVALNKGKFDLVISDIQMGGMSGLTLLQDIFQQVKNGPNNKKNQQNGKNGGKIKTPNIIISSQKTIFHFTLLFGLRCLWDMMNH